MSYKGYFLLAFTLKKQLHEILGWEGPMTHRQYLAWLHWLRSYEVEQLNQPGRTEYYLMQIAHEVARSNERYSKPNQIKMDQFKLKFIPRESTAKISFRSKTRVAMTKAHWIHGLGVKPVEVSA